MPSDPLTDVVGGRRAPVVLSEQRVQDAERRRVLAEIRGTEGDILYSTVKDLCVLAAVLSTIADFLQLAFQPCSPFVEDFSSFARRRLSKSSKLASSASFLSTPPCMQRAAVKESFAEILTF